ncbi:MAG TPA: ribonuclease P protein component [Cellvibrio sp.]
MPAEIEFQQPASSNQAQDFRFGKPLRLLCAADFKPVFDDAPLRASHQNFLILARFNQLPHARLGLVMAKKHIRHAVERNRMKRLIRENFRLQQQAFAGVDMILLSRTGLDKLSNSEFTQQLNQQWQRIFKKMRHHRLTSHTHSSLAANAEPPQVNADGKTAGH